MIGSGQGEDGIDAGEGDTHDWENRAIWKPEREEG